MNLNKIFISSAIFILLLYVILIASAFYFFDGHVFIDTITSKRTLFSISISLGAATIASVLSIFIAIPAAYALSRYKFAGRNIIDIILELPLIISPAALGALLLIFFSNPLGNFIQKNTIQFVYTFWGIVLAQFITTLGIATRLVKAAMDELPKRYEQVARILGATHKKAFFTVTLPLSKQGILAAFFLTWAKAFGEFGATVTIAGTMAMKTETIPISIFMKLANADIKSSIVLIFILLLIGISVLIITRLIAKNTPYA
ncbi:MAG: ABC transporter permease [Chlorobi bacterium]|nr:ABC transporter permease [Chlorobiota bacterium]